MTAAPPDIAELESVYNALVQAQDCIRGETPEDMTHEQASEDTINKIRDAMRTLEAMTTLSDGAIYAAVSQRNMTPEEDRLIQKALLDSGELVSTLPRCDAETAGAIARDVVTEWLGMFDPPPQIDFMQSEMLQAAIGARLAVSSADRGTP